MKWGERRFRFLAWGAVLALAAHWAFGAEKALDVDDIPAKVREALKAKWPKAKIEHAASDEVKGRTVYGFELSEGAGQKSRKWLASFNADGKLRESREELKPGDLPKPVLQGLQKKFPVIQKAAVERITEGEGKTAKVTYEFKFAMQVNVDASGKIIDEKELDFDV